MKLIQSLKSPLLALLLLILPSTTNAEVHSTWEMKGAQERIQKFRMGTTRVVFVQADGSPIEQELLVSLELKKHAFQFGIGVGQSWALFNEKNFERYRSHMSAIFNLFTIGFQWSWMEKKEGQVKSIKHIESNLEWARAKGINIKGTPLIWHNAIPNWLYDNTKREVIESLITKRINHLIREYPEVKTWNLYNEAPGAENKLIKNNPIANWVKSKGGAAAAQAWVSQIAHEAASDKIYVNNHYSYKDPVFKNMNSELIKLNAKFNAIGIQTHMHTKKNRLSEQDLWNLLEEYEVFGKPIHLTEMSVPSSNPFIDWHDFRPHVKALQKAEPKEKRLPLARSSNIELERYQADYLRDFYTLAFSHPNVDALIYWSGSDLYEWRGTAAGLLDVNHNPKPAYHTLKNLIKNKWHTKLTDFTDPLGRISFSGFFGKYTGNIVVDGTEYSFTFEHMPGKLNDHVIILNQNHKFSKK